MDVIPSHYVIINFVIKGGPPWGFRIKQRGNRVVVSKVNCGGRAAKIGLRIQDEIIAVNNLEVDKQPLTLNRESNNETDELQSLQLTKLDFTYQLIRHTVQRQLHLTIRRFVLSPCQRDEDYECDTYCSHLEGGPCHEEGWSFPELYTQSEEEILSPDEEQDYLENQRQLQLNNIKGPRPSLLLTHPVTAPLDSGIHHRISYSSQASYGHPCDPCRNIDHHLLPETLETIESSSEVSSQTSSQIRSLYDSRRRSLELRRDLAPLLVRTYSQDSMSDILAPKFKAKAPKNIWSPGSTTTSCSGDSPVVAKKKIQTIAQSTQTTPTKVPGDASSSAPVLSSSASRFEVTPTLTSNLAASAPGAMSSVVRDLEPPTTVIQDATSSEPSPDLLNINNNNNNNNMNLLDPDAAVCLSPSSMSEISIETAMTSKPAASSAFSPPSSPQLLSAVEQQAGQTEEHGKKFWTLPRSISMGQREEVPSAESKRERGLLKRHETIDVPPSSHEPVLLSSEKKFFTLPSSSSSHLTTEKTAASSSSLDSHARTEGLYPSSISAVAAASTSSASAPVLKYQGIGPVNEQGVPLSARSQVQEQHASDWYKSMYKRLHTLQRSRRDEEPIRIKVKTRRPKEYRFDANYFSDDEATIPRPRHISEYVTGSSSISEREKQMFYADLINYIDTIFSNVFKTPPVQPRPLRPQTADPVTTTTGKVFATAEEERSRVKRELEMATRAQEEQQRRDERTLRATSSGPDHDKTCVFSALTHSHPLDNGSSFVFKKKAKASGSSSSSEPASRSAYIAVQKGDTDIPLSGLQKPAPQPKAHKEASKKKKKQRLQSRHFNPRLPYTQPPLTMTFGQYQDWSEQNPPKRPPPPASFFESSIDDWQRKVNEDFNQLYLSLYKNPGDFGRQSLMNPKDQAMVTQTMVSQNNRPQGEIVVPSVVVTDVKDKTTIEKIDKIERKEQIFDPVDQTGNYSSSSYPFGEPDSPHQFNEAEVNIHYRAPVTQLRANEQFLAEDALRRSAQMRRYQDSDLESRRSTSREREALARHHYTPTRESIPVHLNRYQRAFLEKESSQMANLQLARAMYDFHALSPREISVKKEDVVIIRKAIDHNWLEVEDAQSGLKGMVPRNYLDCQQEGSARAKFDFEAKTSIELPLKKGDDLRLIRKVDDNWYEGMNVRNQVGIFPCSYVQTIKQPIYLQLNNNLYCPSPSTSQPHSSTTGRSLSPLDSSRPTSPSRYRAVSSPVQFSSGNRDRADSQTYSQVTRPQKVVGSRGGGGGGGSKYFRVIYPYKPQQSDELQLVVGDILTVSMQCDDGWFVGQSTLSGTCGTFPGNYVQPMD